MEDSTFTKFPNESILLDIELDLEPWELVFKALKISINDRNLQNKIKVRQLKNKSQLIINGFYVQIVIQEFIDEEIDIPIKRWFIKGYAPQLILPAYVDQENNIVYFPGVITSDEFIKLFPNTISDEKEISLSFSRFSGGIDLLFNYVLLLNANHFSRNGFVKGNSLVKYKRNLKIVSVFAITSIGLIFIPKVLNPKLALNISNLKGQNYLIANNLRSLYNETISQMCVISPQFDQNPIENKVYQYSSINKPYILSKTPLKEIKLYKNNNLIWSKTSIKGEFIDGILAWPTEPIQNKNIYKISFRPVGSSIGNYKEIIFSSETKKIKDLDKIINALGNKNKKWINMINKNIKKDPNLSLALLFSKDNPKSQKLKDFKSELIKNINCSNE